MNYKINEQIKGTTVRVVGHQKYQNDIVSLYDALRQAKEEGLDLVLINPTEKPVICKILDYSKFMYDMNKNKKKNSAPPLKEIKFSPNIAENDLEVKINMARKFLTKGSPIKVEVFFKGREITHKEIGETALLKFLDKISDIGIFDVNFKYTGKKLIHNIRPRKLS